MIEGATSETNGFRVQLLANGQCYSMFIPGADREEAEMAGHLAASELLGLDEGFYRVYVTPATDHEMAEKPKAKRGKRGNG